MAHDVFISYSHLDQPVADGICANLEADGLRCWIAPRDIGPGEDWPTAIANGIAGSKMMVLVFSQNSNMSEEVSRELYLAANNKVIIIPFVIENVKPEAGKAYYLGRTHWLDAMNPPTVEQIGQLIQSAHSLLSPEAGAERAGRVISAKRLLQIGRQVHRKRPWALPMAVLLMVALVFGGITIVPKIRAAFAVGLSPASSIDPSFYLLREDFTNKEYDGALPPDWGLAADWCSNISVAQEKGSMTFKVPANIQPGCSMGPGRDFFLKQINAVEFAISDAKGTPIEHSSFSFMLAGTDNGQKSLFMICGLNGNSSGCVAKLDQQDVYRTKTFVEKPGESYTFRIEVLDLVTMSFRFLVNGENIGEFTMLPADVPVYQDLSFRVNGGVVGAQASTNANEYYLDYLAVEQR